MLTNTTSKNEQTSLNPGFDFHVIKEASAHFEPASALNLLTGHVNSAAVNFQKKIHGPTWMAGDNSHLHQGSLKSGTGDRFDPEAALTNFCGDGLLRAEMAVTLPPFPRPTQSAYFKVLERLGWVVNRFQPVVDGYGRVTENEREVDGSVRDSILAAAEDAKCQSIVLFGGDGGFTRAVKCARRAGKAVFVCAWANTLHPDLAAAATDHISLEILRPLILRAYH